MAELAEPVLIQSNPLYNDQMLFGMYMRALDALLADSELRAAMDEFRLSPNTLRGKMIRGARRVLQTAPREFAVYEAAQASLSGIPEQEAQAQVFRFADAVGYMLRMAFDSEARAQVFRFADDFGYMLRMAFLGVGLVGALFAVAGVASIPAWPWTEPLVWAGASMIVAAGLLSGVHWLLGTRLGLTLLRGELILGINPELDEARTRLMAAISQDELLAQARTVINITRQDRFGHAYSVAGTSGLSETFDSTFQVPTGTAAELDGLLARLDGASIGVAGPRGSGKSTLIRGYCDEPVQGNPQESSWRGLRAGEVAVADLRCAVAAPVDYAARDFVLHLFAVFCRSVIRRSRTKTRLLGRARIVACLYAVAPAARSLLLTTISFGVPAVVLVHWQQPLASSLGISANWIYFPGIVIALLGDLKLALTSGRTAFPARANVPGSKGHALAATARRHLARVRYLQTYTSGWSGAMRLPGGDGQFSRGYSRAEQPLSYPEIVGEFRAFAGEVAADIYRDGGRVFVGIDELDKIGAPEQAEHFLNEIKGIFGIPHVYFMVSVSDDALTAFERRGLPLRDAFDSSFDEIIHVGPLSYLESRRLLYRRVIGLTEPYVALCHCLAGGLARDLIRAARQVIRAGQTLAGSNPSSPDDQGELDVDSSTAFLLLREPPTRQPPALGVICAAVVREELRRKTRAVAHVASSTAPGQAQDLQHALYDIVRQLAPGAPALKIVDIACQPGQGESAAMTSLRLDFAAYAYYCATLQDVFTDHLDAEHMIKATSASPEPGSFDALAAARHAFALDTLLAWRSISQFRKAWSLETRDPVSGDGTITTPTSVT